MQVNNHHVAFRYSFNAQELTQLGMSQEHELKKKTIDPIAE